ncbi:hypothetical protein F2Q68_00012663 [Brassica cretica]|uniref:Uncharacterized protein n=2 Tax=Brassica cretica TaxID=69181 RepID=A0ABQ7EUV3_BRACR|nr:hypothetical protein F2Q68_00012663 [Brassica cretica]KAF3607438.1 hypothetical protein DY000_02044140 [Brassica cretica]
MVIKNMGISGKAQKTETWKDQKFEANLVCESIPSQLATAAWISPKPKTYLSSPSKHFRSGIAMVMNPSKVAGHARFLLESFRDSEVDSIAQGSVIIPVLKTCLDCFAARRSHPNSSQLEKLISLVFKRVLKHSNLISHALQDVEVTDEFAADLTNALDFSISDKISFALSLVEFDSSDDANATSKLPSSFRF